MGGGKELSDGRRTQPQDSLVIDKDKFVDKVGFPTRTPGERGKRR